MITTTFFLAYVSALIMTIKMLIIPILKEMQPENRVRFRAIQAALFYGFYPWWIYEQKRHYSCSYLHHLKLNLLIALRWATWHETARDHQFERMANNNF